MKKLIALGLLLVCIITLCSCQKEPLKLPIPVISEDVTKVDISYYAGGRTTNWSVEGAEVDLLKEWLNNLSLEPVLFLGSTPGDCDGPSSYTFYLDREEPRYFTYLFSSAEKQYIRYEGNWFVVTNPSDPPVTQELP